MSAVAEYLKWRRGPAVGCVFARLMSAIPGDYGQVVEEVTHSDTAEVAATIATRVEQLIPIRRALAVAFVLPGVQTLEEFMAMVLGPRNETIMARGCVEARSAARDGLGCRQGHS